MEFRAGSKSLMFNFPELALKAGSPRGVAILTAGPPSAQGHS